MNKPALTVIIPAFNADRQLPACLHSLFRQTVPISVLVVDDGSSDGTAGLLDAEEKKERIRVLRRSNAGANAAREAGLQFVDTPYFAFLDADDTWEPTFAAEMLNRAYSHSADLVFCSYRCIYDGIERQISYAGKNDYFNHAEYPIQKRPYLLRSIPVFLWGKLFRTAYIKSRLNFAPRECAPVEDIPTMIPLLIETPRIVKVDKPLYRYSITSSSMCRATKQELSRLVAMRVLHQRLNSMGALPKFTSELSFINRCFLFDQLEKLSGYCDPKHQHRVVKDYFEHLSGMLPGWRPHAFHPTFYAAYWHALVTWNTFKKRLSG